MQGSKGGLGVGRHAAVGGTNAGLFAGPAPGGLLPALLCPIQPKTCKHTRTPALPLGGPHTLPLPRQTTMTIRAPTPNHLTCTPA